MNKPRTPKHFPKMKHRAAGRLARRKVQQFSATIETVMKVTKVFGEVIEEVFTRASIILSDALTAMAAIFRPAPTQADFVLVDGPRFPPMTMMVSSQRQAEISTMLTRSYELAVQRGHIRRHP